MKKLLFPAMAFLVLGFAAHAQDVKYGIKAGLNLSTFTGDDSDGAENLAGFSGGLVAEIPVSTKFAVQAEVLYSMQGAKANFTGPVEGSVYADAEIVSRLNYIAIPVMAKLYPVKGFSIEAGPQVAFLASAKNKVEGTLTDIALGYSQPFKSSQNANKMYKGTDFGLNIGTGYRFENGVFLQARYTFGLTEIGDSYTEDGVSYEAGKVKNSVFTFALGYNFK